MSIWEDIRTGLPSQTAKELMDLVFEVLGKSQFLPRFEGLNGMEVYKEISGKRQWLCPVCKSGMMHPYHQNISSD